mgnify:FL=1|jgi:hypothetical protein|tara:strand:- start:834 stop:1037 length:204 start_codon:yes stop_codon:yes gene_type:complete
MTDLETRPVPPELSMFTRIEATQQTCGLLIVHLMAQVQLDDPKLTDAERESLIIQASGAPVLFIPEA